MGTSTIGPTTARTRRSRVSVLSAVLLVSALVVAVSFLARPLPELEAENFAELGEVRESAWLFGLLGAFGLTVAYVAYGAAAHVLTPARGSVFGTVGGLLVALGGIAFGVGYFSSVTLMWYLTAPVEENAGQEVFLYFLDNPAQALAPHIAGHLTVMVGVILVSIGLWRARSLPIAVALAPAALVIVAFFFDAGFVQDLLRALFMVSLAVIAAYMWLGNRRTPT